MAATVVVCGSLNVDTFVRVREFPTAGETVIASPVPLPGALPGGNVALGGKGANQAVAAARFARADRGQEGDAGGADATVRLLATVGEDAAGAAALDALRAAGVDVSGCTVSPDAPTGSAFIMNDVDGENVIVVTSGANTLTDPAEAPREVLAETSTEAPGESARVLLAQGELTPGHSAALPALADRLGARFVLNLAPVTVEGGVRRDLVASADPLVVNGTEAADVLGVPRDTGLDEVLDGLAAAVGRGLCRSAVVTLGAQGALVVDGDGGAPVTVASPVPEKVVDTTGAGDAFCGTLATALALGMSLVDAARYAAAAGSLAVGEVGAASSYADGDTVRELTETLWSDQDDR